MDSEFVALKGKPGGKKGPDSLYLMAPAGGRKKQSIDVGATSPGGATGGGHKTGGGGSGVTRKASSGKLGPADGESVLLVAPKGGGKSGPDSLYLFAAPKMGQEKYVDGSGAKKDDKKYKDESGTKKDEKKYVDQSGAKKDDKKYIDQSTDKKYTDQSADKKYVDQSADKKYIDQSTVVKKHSATAVQTDGTSSKYEYKKDAVVAKTVEATKPSGSSPEGGAVRKMSKTGISYVDQSKPPTGESAAPILPPEAGLAPTAFGAEKKTSQTGIAYVDQSAPREDATIQESVTVEPGGISVGGDLQPKEHEIGVNAHAPPVEEKDMACDAVEIKEPVELSVQTDRDEIKEKKKKVDTAVGPYEAKRKVAEGCSVIDATFLAKAEAEEKRGKLGGKKSSTGVDARKRIDEGCSVFDPNFDPDARRKYDTDLAKGKKITEGTSVIDPRLLDHTKKCVVGVGVGSAPKKVDEGCSVFDPNFMKVEEKKRKDSAGSRKKDAEEEGRHHHKDKKERKEKDKKEHKKERNDEPKKDKKDKPGEKAHKKSKKDMNI